MSRATLSMAAAWTLGLSSGLGKVTAVVRRRLLSRGIVEARAVAAHGRHLPPLTESEMIALASHADLGEMAAVAIEMLDLSKR